jgi:hypothetical protein
MQTTPMPSKDNLCFPIELANTKFRINPAQHLSIEVEYRRC